MTRRESKFKLRRDSKSFNFSSHVNKKKERTHAGTHVRRHAGTHTHVTHEESHTHTSRRLASGGL